MFSTFPGDQLKKAKVGIAFSSAYVFQWKWTAFWIFTKLPSIFTANHNGYAYIDGSPEHTREWIIEEKRILIIDTVTGNYNDAISRLYLHPDIIIENNNFLILPSGKSCKFSTSCKNLKKIRSSWSPEFGIKKANYCFEMDFSEKRIESAISWI